MCLHCDEQALIVCQPQIPYNSRRLMEEPARPGQEEPVGLGGQAEPGRAARLPAAHRRDPGPCSVSWGVGMGKCVTACLPHPFCRSHAQGVCSWLRGPALCRPLWSLLPTWRGL